MREISGVEALPMPESGRVDYVRNLIDPRVLIHGKSGECFVRRDGAEWDWPGYKVGIDPRNMQEYREPATGPEDSRVVKRNTKAA